MHENRDLYIPPPFDDFYRKYFKEVMWSPYRTVGGGFPEGLRPGPHFSPPCTLLLFSTKAAHPQRSWCVPVQRIGSDTHVDVMLLTLAPQLPFSAPQLPATTPLLASAALQLPAASPRRHSQRAHGVVTGSHGAPRGLRKRIRYGASCASALPPILRFDTHPTPHVHCH